ncbi:hypothetical protein [Pedobacter faecalis]|uniref:hypothetical protein n=1 Tax=Pedobacter faecalis TaxID=3041495 RepID=UPI00254B8FA8|nr:hypothetical protein [Pedobacter sp. ELA7]
MKRKICFSVLGILLAACSSNPDEKAKILIKSYLDTTLINSESYEPLKYGSIDTVFSKQGGVKYFNLSHSFKAKNDSGVSATYISSFKIDSTFSEVLSYVSFQQRVFN